MSVTRTDYGPVSVVRNPSDPLAYASVEGPDDHPVIIKGSAESSDGTLVRRAVLSCLQAWDRVGGPPPALRRALDRAVTFRPEVLLPLRPSGDEAQLYSVQPTKERA